MDSSGQQWNLFSASGGVAALLMSANPMLTGMGYVIFCALCLKRAAEHARRNALQRLELRILESKRVGGDNKDNVTLLEFAQQSIASMARGAFLPIPQQPWLQTLLLLFGGGGSFLLLEYMVWVE